MADVLTMNDAPQEEGFSADEKESLLLGQAMADGEDTSLLAGKFKDPEALEKAYLELQTKLGQRDEVQTIESESEPEPAQVEKAPSNDRLNKEQADHLMDQVGGEDSYRDMLKWASQNFSEEEISMYDDVMKKADPNAVFYAVQALQQRYNDSVGVDGQTLTGRGAGDGYQGFRSQAELIRAMEDPRYSRDPAYRDELMNRLAVSDVEF